MLLARDEVTSQDLEILKTFVTKQERHYENVAMWLKAFLTVNSASIAAYVLVARGAPQSESPVDQIVTNGGVLLPIAVIGLLMSISWILVGWDASKWQKRMNRVIGEAEAKLLREDVSGMWGMINESYPPERRGWSWDIAEVTQIVPAVFIVSWAGIIMSLACGR